MSSDPPQADRTCIAELDEVAYKNLRMSAYAHEYAREDFVAIFHALKLKPTYLDRRLSERVKHVLSAPEEYTEEALAAAPGGSEVIEACSLLVDNRVLSDTPGRDDHVIRGFRRSVGPPQIKIAYFVLAEACNLACTYCFERTPEARPSKSRMSVETAMNCLDFYERALAEYDSAAEDKEIIFYGGEPMLSYDTLVATLTEVRRRREASPARWRNLNCTMVTNGTLLTASRLEELCTLGLGIGISVDGPEEVTNANRFYRSGRGAFRGAMRAISLCRAQGVPFSLSITLSEAAVRDYDGVMALIRDVSPASVGFNVLLSQEAGEGHSAYHAAAAEFLIRAFIELRSRGLYEDRMMRKARAFAASRVYPFDCAATGGNQLVFAPSGEVGICHGYLANKKYFCTTVHDTDFRATSNPTFLQWAHRSPLFMEACQRCPALGICGGGCPMNADRESGSIQALDERFCVHAKRTLEWLVWDLFDKATSNRDGCGSLQSTRCGAGP